MGVVLLFVGSILYFTYTSAATYTWDNGGGDGLWSTCTNWSSDICPGSGDVVVFDATSVADATIDSAYAGSIAGMDIQGGYTGTITQERTLSIGSNGFIQSAGTFQQQTYGFDINDGSFTLNAGTFLSATGTISIERNLTIADTATFTASTSKIWTFDGGSSTDDGTFTYPGVFPGTVSIKKPNDGAWFTIASGTVLQNTTNLNANSGNISINENATLNASNNTITGANLTVSGKLYASSTINLYESFTLNDTGEVYFDGTDFFVEHDYTDNGGLFDETGITFTFDGGNSVDNTTFLYSGAFPGIVVISKTSSLANFTVATTSQIEVATSTTAGGIYVYGILNTKGNPLTANVLHIYSGGLLKIEADQTITTPVLDSESTVVYVGSGTYTTIPDFQYQHLKFETGTYNLTSSFSIAGNFLNTGAFFNQTAGTTTFTGTSNIITGSNTFYNLTKNGTSSATTLTFPVGQTQTVLQTLTLLGASSTARLTLTGGGLSGILTHRAVEKLII